MFKYFTGKRLIRWFLLAISNFPISGAYRWRIIKLAGVTIRGKSYIYRNVIFDRVAPELISIGKNVTITDDVKILTHYLDPNQSGRHYRFGKVVIEDDVFIGIGAIICNSVTIGRGAIIGAGSVVTKDVPEFEVWAGNPARFIKHRKQ